MIYVDNLTCHMASGKVKNSDACNRDNSRIKSPSPWEACMFDSADIVALLNRARAGDAQARGELLDLYRSYLRLLARTQMGSSLRGRLEPSDLVQDAMLDAHRDFSAFAGQSEREL